MKILPLALVLLASPALAQQVSIPKLRKNPPAPVTPILQKAQVAASATPAPSPAPTPTPEKVSGLGRPARTLREVKPKQASATSAKVTEPKPKKGGGMFGFVGRLFGGGKKKSPSAPGASPTAVTPQTASARRPATPGAVAEPGSVTRPNMSQARSGNSTIRPSAPTDTSEQAVRVTVPTAPSTGNARNTTRPAPVAPAPENAAAPSVTKPSAQPPAEKPVSKPLAKPVAKPGPAVPVESASSLPPASSKPLAAGNSTLPGATSSAAGEFDKARYQKIRREAAAEPAVASLGEKLNGTAPGPAYQAAARAYSAALFARMRELDPSQGDWFNRMESATIRRIDAGKTIVAE